MVLAQHAEWKSSDFASAGDAYGCSPVLDSRSSLHRGPPSGIINMKGSFRLETNPSGSFLKLWRAEKLGIQLCANLEKQRATEEKGQKQKMWGFTTILIAPLSDKKICINLWVTVVTAIVLYRIRCAWSGPYCHRTVMKSRDVRLGWSAGSVVVGCLRPVEWVAMFF